MKWKHSDRLHWYAANWQIALTIGKGISGLDKLKYNVILQIKCIECAWHNWWREDNLKYFTYSLKSKISHRVFLVSQPVCTQRNKIGDCLRRDRYESSRDGSPGIPTIPSKKMALPIMIPSIWLEVKLGNYVHSAHMVIHRRIEQAWEDYWSFRALVLPEKTWNSTDWWVQKNCREYWLRQLIRYTNVTIQKLVCKLN